MAQRIEVALKESIPDALGEKAARRIRQFLELPVQTVRTVEVYTIDADLEPRLLRTLAEGPFSDPVVQRPYTVAKPGTDRYAAADQSFDWLVEVAFRPGVTDNVGRTGREALAMVMDLPVREAPGVYSSRQYLIRCEPGRPLTRDEVEEIASGLLGNTLIQRFFVLNAEEVDAGRGLGAVVPKVVEVAQPRVERVNLDLPDPELLTLSRERVLALSLEEMKAIKAYLARPEIREDRTNCGLGPEITDAELECLAQTWSEHCKHKIFNARIHYTDENGKTETIDSLFDTYIRGATRKVRQTLGKDDYCLSVFVDNAGVIKFSEDYSLVFKVETHNSPSALDPYGGALTGIVGVNRDPFGTGKGCRLFFNTNIFCLAPPRRRAELPPRLLQPVRVLEGVREGVEHGGNKCGIPTVNGSVLFDERYLGKPLVYCGTGGIMPSSIRNEPSHIKKARPGDRIVMCGGRIGKDGIHGATFSSEELHEGSPATAVQIGDPITQKRMFDMLLRARDEGLYTSITDNGAGGLSSSTGEMAEQSGGAELDLSKAPLKYASLQPWEILLSEAQERMNLAVPPDKLNRFLELAEQYQVEATVLGTFNDSGFFTVKYGEQVVARLEMGFLHDGLPGMELEAKFDPPTQKDPDLEPEEDMNRCLLSMMRRLNICSKEYWVRQYDHEVQGGSVVKPLTGAEADGPSDAAVIRPILESHQAVVIAHGICPRYSDLDAYHMASCAADEAVRNAVCVGADPSRMAALDNFCWCDPVQSPTNPDGRHKLAQLVRANQGLHDLCVAYGLPLISGKDSMKNDYRAGDIKISIPPTLLVSLMGRMDDARQAVTMDAKAPGDLVYVLGPTRRELGASEYLAHKGHVGHSVPKVRIAENYARYAALGRAIRNGLVRSCHDCSDGGLGVALAETALAGNLGLEVDLANVPLAHEDGRVDRDEAVLFSESAGRFVLTAEVSRKRELESLLGDHGLGLVGSVTDHDRLTMTGLAGTPIVDVPVDALKRAWKEPLSF